MYAKIQNNTIVQYPADPMMDNPFVSFPSNWGGGDINGTKYVVVNSVSQPSANLGWIVTESSPVISNGVCNQTWSNNLLPIEFLKTAISNKRYEVEVSGTVVANNKYATDRESQTKYVAVALDISQSNAETWSIKWKTSNPNLVEI